MRNNKYHFLTILLVVCSACGDKDPKELSAPRETNSEIENFNIFLEDFSLNEDFQLSRIKFPLPDCDYPGDEDSNCTYIKREDWKRLVLIDTTNPSSTIRNIYDNFNLEMRNSGERVVAFEATETNICAYYFFQLQTDQWYLIKRLVCADY